jgi:hypothetical protein
MRLNILHQEVSKENSDKTDKEEDDKKKKVPVPPCQEVYKQGQLVGQSDRGVHNNNTDDSSNDELILTPLAPQRVLQLGQLTCGTNSNINQFTRDMTSKKREHCTPHKLRLNSVICLHAV